MNRVMGRLLPGWMCRVGLVVCGCLLGCSSSNVQTGTNPPAAPAVTATSLTVSGSTVAAGGTVMMTASVTSASATVASGSVNFLDGTTTLGTAAVSATGGASYTTSALTAGSHALTAAYVANGSFAASTSAAQTLTVTAPVLTSTVTLAASSSSTTQGLPVEFTATVAPGSGTAVPTGMITLLNGSTPVGTAMLDPTGTAIYTDTLLAPGGSTLTANYSGDTSYASANSSGATVSVAAAAAQTYTNPLNLEVTATQAATSCADPAIYKYQASGVDTWYLYCTADALYPGDPNSHYINIFKSSDLVNYTYVGDAFTSLPSWANVSGVSLFAPSIKYFNGQYYLYYAPSQTNSAGAAIGVGTSSSPAGPFIDSGAPIVAPQLATNCCTGAYRSEIDPDEIQDASGQRYLVFGSFTGGLFVRKLSADGLTTDASSEVQVAVDARYEGGNWVFYNGYYYLLASSTNCCNGPLSGYGVFAGRSLSPMGPYVDAQGIAMTAVNAGGTPVLKMNGNSVIGPGGNVVFQDESGQYYILYHGIVASSPYYAGNVGYTARPAYLDALDWVNGWPVTRGGFGPSDAAAPQPLPAAQPGGSDHYVTVLALQDTPRTEVAGLSDEFNTTTLSPQWTTIHSVPAYTLAGSAYSVPTVGYDTTNAMSSIPLLAEGTPSGDYMVETSLSINLPLTGGNSNYAQGGLIIYGDDNNYVRLDVAANSDTRQIEFIKGVLPASGYPNYGGTNLGPPALTSTVNAYLRIVKRNVDGQEHYTAYSSMDDVTWTQSGTWDHVLGSTAKICLYGGNLAGYTVNFDYVHVSTVN